MVKDKIEEEVLKEYLEKRAKEGKLDTLKIEKICREVSQLTKQKVRDDFIKIIDECEITEEYNDPDEDEYDFKRGVDGIRELISKSELKKKLSELKQNSGEKA